VMPGLISAHSHASTLLDRGLVDNLPLEPWLLQTVMTGGDVNPRECYAATALSATEFLRSEQAHLGVPHVEGARRCEPAQRC